MKHSPAILVEEIPGDRYPDLETAQRVALPTIAANFQTVIQDLVARGVLVQVDGKLIPNPSMEKV